MTRATEPVTKDVIDFLAELETLPMSGEERAQRYRAKKQAGKLYTSCQQCNVSLISKWGTLRGTDDVTKAICTTCKADITAKANNRVKAARRGVALRTRQFKFLTFDGRYEGPWAKSNTSRSRTPKRDRVTYTVVLPIRNCELQGTEKEPTAEHKYTQRTIPYLMFPQGSAERFTARKSLPLGKTATDLGYEVSDSAEWLSTRRTTAPPIKVYEYTPVPMTCTTLKRFGHTPQWPIDEESTGWTMPHTDRDLLDYERLASVCEFTKLCHPRKSKIKDIRYVSDVCTSNLDEAVKENDFDKDSIGSIHDIENVVVHQDNDQGPDDFEGQDAFEPEDFEFDPDEDLIDRT